MGNDTETMEKPALANGQAVLTKSTGDFDCQKNIFREIFSHVLSLGESYLDKLIIIKSSDKTYMDSVKLQIRALLSTGLFTKEKVINAISTTMDKDLQKMAVRAWLTSDKLPTKNDCVDLMNSFARTKDHLVAEVMLCRAEDFPFMSIGQFLIDNIDKPLSMELCQSLEEGMPELKKRKDK